MSRVKVVKCLWGDEFQVDEDEDPLIIENIIYEKCELNRDKVYVVVAENDEDDSYDFYAVCVPRSQVIILDERNLIDKYRFQNEWLRTTKNSTLILHFLEYFYEEMESPIYANPHPSCVQRVFEYIAKTGRTPERMCANSADEIVDFLISHPHLINWSDLCLNTNPRVAVLVKEAIMRGDTQLSLSEVARIENDELVQFLWETFGGELFRMRAFRLNDSSVAVKLQIAYFDHLQPSEKYDVLRKFARSRQTEAVLFYVNRHSHYDEYDHTNRSSLDDELWTNPHYIAVEYALTQPRIRHFQFCTNPNELAVEYYEKNPEKIVWPEYLENSHPSAVSRGIDWLRENQVTQRVVASVIKNTNPDMVVYVAKELCRHLSPPILTEMVARMYPSDNYFVFLRNKNVRM